MATSEIIAMVKQALEAMLIGVPSVFIVLAVFYFVLKLMMLRTMRQSAKDRAAKQDSDQA